MNDTLVLSLYGDIPLDLFAKTVQRFHALLDSLVEEVAGKDVVRWDISHLSSGSAHITVRGWSDDLAAVTGVVRAYDAIGDALQHSEPVPFSSKVAVSAYALTSVLDGYITSIGFGTTNAIHKVDTPVSEQQTEQPDLWISAWGTLQGEVGAIAKRPRLQFTLYETLFDRAVACFLSKDKEELARDIWGKRVAVTGRIIRRRDDNRPIRVRDVVDVQVSDRRNGRYRAARGAVPWSLSDEYPEVWIRQLRNGT